MAKPQPKDKLPALSSNISRNIVCFQSFSVRLDKKLNSGRNWSATVPEHLETLRTRHLGRREVVQFAEKTRCCRKSHYRLLQGCNSGRTARRRAPTSSAPSSTPSKFSGVALQRSQPDCEPK